jgi:hypothetical protein
MGCDEARLLRAPSFTHMQLPGEKIQLELVLSYAFAGTLVYNEDDLGQVSSKW